MSDVIELLRSGDHELTVTGRDQINQHYLRLSFAGGGLLTDHEVRPIMRIRMRVPDHECPGRKSHQPGYTIVTIVNPDPVADTFDIEFTLRDGITSRWARTAQPGDRLTASVLDDGFVLPQPSPAGYVIVGDTASLSAVNSLLAAIGDRPAQVFLAADRDADVDLPLARNADVVWTDASHPGELVAAVSAAAHDAADHFGWVASDNRTTRAIAKVLRDEYRIPRGSIRAQAYRAHPCAPDAQL